MSTGNWVSLYTIGYMLLILFYCLPRITIQIVDPGIAIDIASWLGTDSTSGIPLQIFGWGLLAITSGYAGLDRASMAVKTSLMEIGTCDMGNPVKLRKVIYLLFVVFIESVVLNFFFGKDYSVITSAEVVVFNKLSLPLDSISSALVSTICIYILGNKSIRVTQNVDRTGGEANEDVPWANEHESVTIIDDNSKEKVDDKTKNNKNSTSVSNNDLDLEELNTF